MYSSLNSVYVQYNNTILIDINHEAPATAQASFNLVRCIMAALATGVIQYMIEGIGFGWTFAIFGGSAALSAILYLVEMKRGMKWRVGKQTKKLQQVVKPQLEGTLAPPEKAAAKV